MRNFIITCTTLGLASICMAEPTSLTQSPHESGPSAIGTRGICTTVLTENTQCAIDDGGAIACAGGGITTDNFYARNMVSDGDYIINCVTWGSGAGDVATTAIINIYSASAPGNPSLATLTLLGTVTQTTDPLGALYTTFLTAPIGITMGQNIVVEIFAPAGTGWPYATTSATGISWLMSADCGILTYDDAGGLGQLTHNMVCLGGSAGTVDPCMVPLPTLCPEDINGDGSIAVSDVLDVIGSWGQVGDGTFRPLGDIAPLPLGDCAVNVTDILAIMAAWGADCNIYGGCCLDDGTCSVVTAADCAAAFGTYFGDNTTCVDGVCVSGACCLSTVSCSDLTVDACVALGGLYKGDGTACVSTDCSVVTPGDECADAIVVVDGANAFDTTIMTPSLPIPTCAADAGAFGWTTPSIDMWFSWTAGATDTYILDTCDVLSFDTSVVVYDGACGALNQVACNGDAASSAGCQAFSSDLEFAATLGTTYTIRLGGWGPADAGVGTLNINVKPPPLPGACCFAAAPCLDSLDSVTCGIFGGVFAGEGTVCATSCVAPAGDECIDAVVAVLGANAFDTTLMTSSAEVVSGAACAGTFLNWSLPNPDAWLVWTAPASGTADFSACDALGTDTSMVIYSGSCGALVEEACNGDSTVETGCQAFYSGVYGHPVVAGTDYFIRMGSYLGTNSGPGTLTITFIDPSASAACCVAGVCSEMTSASCATAGGIFYSGSLCIDVICVACPAGSVPEGLACAVDGIDPALDANGGLNVIPNAYGAVTLGTPICGNGSVFVAADTTTNRDLDWYTNATLDLGGSFTISGGAAAGVNIMIVELTGAGTVVEILNVPGGTEGSLAVILPVPATGYALVIGPDDFVLGRTCVSGLADHWVSITSP